MRKKCFYQLTSLFPFCAGLLLGHRHQPKGGRFAYTAKEKAAIWRAGEFDQRKSAYTSVFFSIWLASYLHLRRYVSTSASALFCSAFSHTFLLILSLPHADIHMQTHTRVASAGVHSHALCNCLSLACHEVDSLLISYASGSHYIHYILQSLFFF